MRRALARLDESLSRIRIVTADMDSRALSSTPQRRLLDDTLRCSCTVTLSGFFESFLKDCVESCVKSITARQVNFADLPQATRHRHFEGGGQLVGRKARGHSRSTWVTADHFDIAQRLSSPSRSGQYILVWEAFADTRGNPSPSVVLSILKSLGVTNGSSRLGTLWGGSYDPKRLALESFIAMRNECAHTGMATAVPSTSDLRDYCDLIYAFGNGIVTVLEQRLARPPFGFNLNSASFSDLQQVPGMGQQRVSALLSFRDRNGPFRTIRDVAAVPGFGTAIVAVLSTHAHV